MHSAIPIHRLVEAALASIEILRTQQPQLTGTPSGLYDLDQMIGGFQPGNLYVIAGRPGMGKTNFALGAVIHAAISENRPVAVYATTADAASLVQRMLAQTASVALQHLSCGDLNPSAWTALQKAAAILSSAPVVVTEASGLDLSRIVRGAQEAYKPEVGLALLAVDGLQRFKNFRRVTGPSSQKVKPAEAEELQSADLAAILEGLKELAVQLHCPVVLTWQLGPEIDQRIDKQPVIGDLHLSECMEDSIDCVLLLFREDCYRTDEEWNGEAELLVSRNRNGPTGSVYLAYETRFGRFTTLAAPLD